MTGHRFGFEKLAVYQEARTLVLAIYETTRSFPTDERFGLTAQLNRSAVSVAANIAEGSARASFKEQAQFSQVAYSSLMEVLCHLDVAKELGFLKEERLSLLRKQIESVSNKLNALRRTQVQRSRQS